MLDNGVVIFASYEHLCLSQIQSLLHSSFLPGIHSLNESTCVTVKRLPVICDKRQDLMRVFCCLRPIQNYEKACSIRHGSLIANPRLKLRDQIFSINSYRFKLHSTKLMVIFNMALKNSAAEQVIFLRFCDNLNEKSSK